MKASRAPSLGKLSRGSVPPFGQRSSLTLPLVTQNMLLRLFLTAVNQKLILHRLGTCVVPPQLQGRVVSFRISLVVPWWGDPIFLLWSWPRLANILLGHGHPCPKSLRSVVFLFHTPSLYCICATALSLSWELSSFFSSLERFV